MTLPSTGPLSIGQIRGELGSASGSLAALSTQEGKGAPHSISEFRGYSFGPSIPSFGVAFEDTAPGRVRMVVSVAGGATPQVFDIQRSESSDFAAPVVLLSQEAAGTYYDPQLQESFSRTVYYRARAYAQGKVSGWNAQSVLIPATTGGRV